MSFLSGWPSSVTRCSALERAREEVEEEEEETKIQIKCRQ
jgi:hypothetical protein